MASVAALSRATSAAGSSSSADVVRHDDARVTADQAAGTASIRTLGTGAAQACAGNDARLSDARTPTTHTHSPTIVAIGNVGNGGTLTADLSAGTIHRATATGAGFTLAVPTNPVDGAQINVEVLASTSTSMTVHASILLTTGITTPIAIASGKRWFGGLRYVTGVGWFLLASTVQS